MHRQNLNKKTNGMKLKKKYTSVKLFVLIFQNFDLIMVKSFEAY